MISITKHLRSRKLNNKAWSEHRNVDVFLIPQAQIPVEHHVCRRSKHQERLSHWRRRGGKTLAAVCTARLTATRDIYLFQTIPVRSDLVHFYSYLQHGSLLKCPLEGSGGILRVIHGVSFEAGKFCSCSRKGSTFAPCLWWTFSLWRIWERT